MTYWNIYEFNAHFRKTIVIFHLNFKNQGKNLLASFHLTLYTLTSYVTEGIRFNCRINLKMKNILIETSIMKINKLILYKNLGLMADS